MSLRTRSAEGPEIRYRWKQARSYRAGRRGAIASILLHSSDGHSAGDIETLTEGAVSSHWYVQKDGTIWHFVADADTAFHAGRVIAARYANGSSIGIEQEHVDGNEAWPAALVEATSRLVAFLLEKHHLAVTDVTSHAAAAAPAGRKVDPVGFPWADFRARVAAAGAGWTAVRIDTRV